MAEDGPRPVPARDIRSRHIGRRGYSRRLYQTSWLRCWRWLPCGNMRASIAFNPAVIIIRTHMASISEQLLDVVEPELALSGRSISPGLGIGRAWVVGDVLKCDGSPQPITSEKVECELARLNQAFEDTLSEIEQSASRIEFEFDASLAGIFRAHGAMLRDLFASGEFEQELRSSLHSAETVVRRV